MSRPYININSASYACPTLSLNMTFYKLRGGGTMSITGFSNSISFYENHSNSDGVVGLSYEINTVTTGSLGTSSTTTFTQPTLVVTYGGTVSTTTNVAYQLQGQYITAVSGVTAVGPTLSVYLSSLVSAFSFTGSNLGFSAVANATKITFTAPTNTGNQYNGYTVSGPIAIGASSFTYSTGNLFAGGANTYALVLTYPKLGGYDTLSFTV